jgi:biotin carboxyl carrier protein
LKLGERRIRLDWSQRDETCRFRVESEEERAAEIREVEPGIYSILTAGRSFEARIDADRVSIGGHAFAVEVLDPRRWDRRKDAGQMEGHQNIVATMPGKVVRVLVSEGDQVEAGKGVVVVEAMKMQNELKAPRAGRVVTIAAAAGATVNAGDILASIE